MDCTVIFCDTIYPITFSSVCLGEEKRRQHQGSNGVSVLTSKCLCPLPLCVLELTSSSTVSGMALAWQQMAAILIKRFHHSRRDWKGLLSQILLPVVFMVFAMGLGSIRSDLRHYPELELSPALYNIGPSYSFFRSVSRKCRRTPGLQVTWQG